MGIFPAALRLKWIAGNTGFRLSLRDSIRTVYLGQIGGLPFFHLFGQVAACSAFLKNRGLSVPANLVIAVYERLIALTVSVALAVASEWYLFGRVVLDFKTGGRPPSHPEILTQNDTHVFKPLRDGGKEGERLR